jgi:short-subunit dehydrogenase
LYSASKAFLVNFSEALHLETRRSGVHVTALCPGLTRTPFFDVNATATRYATRTPSWAWQSCDHVADAALKALEANRPVCIPGVQNRLLAALARALPRSAARALVARESWRFD